MASPKRYGNVIRLKPEMVEKYKELHARVWPEVLSRLEQSNFRNYTIYYCDKLGLLFSHYEYVGENYDADVTAIAEDPTTKEWWKVRGVFSICHCYRVSTTIWYRREVLSSQTLLSQ